MVDVFTVRILTGSGLVVKNGRGDLRHDGGAGRTLEAFGAAVGDVAECADTPSHGLHAVLAL